MHPADSDEMATQLAHYASPTLSAAYVLCDRHPADAVAFTIVEPDLSATDVTFGELQALSNRYARALRALGVERDDRVAVLMGKSADLPAVLLAIWRLGAVHVPLFTAFSGPQIESRVRAAGASLLVIDLDQHHKVEQLSAADTGCRVALVDGGIVADVPRLAAIADEVTEEVVPEVVGCDGVIVLMFTSGTVGGPKMVPVPLRALASIESYLAHGLALRADDVYWNAADPGWAYGLYYAILGPLALGRASLLLRSPFSSTLTVEVLKRFGVTNFAAAPTVYRALRAEPAIHGANIKLRCASAAGEPLTTEVREWARGGIGCEVRDHYGQTELGMVIADSWGRSGDSPSGTAGHPMPGWSVVVLKTLADIPAPSNEIGRIAIERCFSPMMWFEGYARESGVGITPHDRRYYLTGDVGIAWPDGSVSVVAREDDVIVMAGYRIGPGEIEAVLNAHPAVRQCGVVGVSDELRGEVVEAFLVLHSDADPSEALKRELQAFVKANYAAHAYPRQVHFVSELPWTPSGKLRRSALRKAREGVVA